MFAQWLRHLRVALLFPPPPEASMQSMDGMGDARLASVQRHSPPNRSALCYVDEQGKVVVKSAFGCRELQLWATGRSSDADGVSVNQKRLMSVGRLLRCDGLNQPHHDSGQRAQFTGEHIHTFIVQKFIPVGLKMHLNWRP